MCVCVCLEVLALSMEAACRLGEPVVFACRGEAQNLISSWPEAHLWILQLGDGKTQGIQQQLQVSGSPVRVHLCVFRTLYIHKPLPHSANIS